MRILLSIKQGNWIVRMKALIDSEAGGMFIHLWIIRKYKLYTQQLANPIIFYNADSSSNKQRQAHQIADIQLKLRGILTHIQALVVNIGNENMLLGLPWLRDTNSWINWEMGQLSFDKKHLHQLKQSIILGKRVWIWVKTNPAMQLAINAKTNQKNKPVKELVPKYLWEFLNQFKKKTSKWLPIYKIYNHTIIMKPEYILKDCKIYSLSPKECLVLQLFIEENRRKEYIWKLKLPQAFLFFYIGKKSGDLWPCQDYQYLNKWMIKNWYPIPLIQNLINQLFDAIIFMKRDVQRVYSNVWIKKRNEWKVAFKTSEELWEPLVMFFGMYNIPEMFQSIMNKIFKDIIAKG